MKKLKIILTLFVLMAGVSSVSGYETNMEGEPYFFFLQGLMLEKQGQFSEAVEVFKKAVTQDPSHAPLRVELGYAYSLLGEPEEARIQALEAIKVDEHYLPAYFLLGTIYLQENRMSEAVAVYEKISQLEPHNESALYVLGTIYLNSENYEKGIGYLKRLCEYHPEHVQGFLVLANAYYLLNRFEEALAVYQKAVQIDAQNVAAYGGMGDVYEKLKDWNNAAEVYKKLLEADPQNTAARYRLAVVYYEKKELEKSAREFTALAKEQRINISIPSIFYLGVINEERKTYPAALSFYQKVIKLINKEQKILMKRSGRVQDVLPAESMVYLRVGYVYLNLYQQAKNEGKGGTTKYLKKAIHYARQAVKYAPQDTVLHYFLGIVLSERRAYTAAIEALQRSIFLKTQEAVGLAQAKKGPELDELYFRLGVLYDQTGNFQEMEYNMQQAIHYNAKNAQALNYLGYSYADRNYHLEVANEYIERSLQIEPDNGAFLDSLGWVCYRLGKYDKALEYLKKALVILKEDSTVLEHVGDVYLALESYKEAEKYWRESLRRNPHNKTLKKKAKQKIPKAKQ